MNFCKKISTRFHGKYATNPNDRPIDHDYLNRDTMVTYAPLPPFTYMLPLFPPCLSKSRLVKVRNRFLGRSPNFWFPEKNLIIKVAKIFSWRDLNESSRSGFPVRRWCDASQACANGITSLLFDDARRHVF